MAYFEKRDKTTEICDYQQAATKIVVAEDYEEVAIYNTLKKKDILKC